MFTVLILVLLSVLYTYTKHSCVCVFSFLLTEHLDYFQTENAFSTELRRSERTKKNQRHEKKRDGDDIKRYIMT